MSKIVDILNELAYELSEFSQNSSVHEIDIFVPIDYFYGINKEFQEYMWHTTNTKIGVQPFDLTINTNLGIKLNIKLKEDE